MKCPKCGNEIENGAKFCPVCGAAQYPPETIRCPGCGTEMDCRASFCPVCGRAVGGQSNTWYNAPPNSRYAAEPIGYRAPIQRRSIPLCLVLSVITCGIYGLYWLYCLTEDLNLAARQENETSGGMVVLLSIVTCSVYEYFWLYQAGKKVNQVHCFAGDREDGSLSLLYLLLGFVCSGLVSYALIQNELNKVAGL